MTLKELTEPLKIEIIDKKSFKLIGCVFYGDPFHSKEEWSKENEIGSLWNRFFKLCNENVEILKKENINDIAYEVHLQPEDYKKTGKFYVYVGIEVKELKNMPLEMFCKTFPTTKYAVFTFKGKEMSRGGEYIWNKWLPGSEYEEAYPYMKLAYDKDRFFGLDNEKSEIDFYVPIKSKNKNVNKMNDEELEIVTFTADNIDSEHICCAIGNDAKNVKRANTKKEWLKERSPEGHTFKKIQCKR